MLPRDDLHPGLSRVPPLDGVLRCFGTFAGNVLEETHLRNCVRGADALLRVRKPARRSSRGRRHADDDVAGELVLILRLIPPARVAPRDRESGLGVPGRGACARRVSPGSADALRAETRADRLAASPGVRQRSREGSIASTLHLRRRTGATGARERVVTRASPPMRKRFLDAHLPPGLHILVVRSRVLVCARRSSAVPDHEQAADRGSTERRHDTTRHVTSLELPIARHASRVKVSQAPAPVHGAPWSSGPAGASWS